MTMEESEQREGSVLREASLFDDQEPSIAVEPSTSSDPGRKSLTLPPIMEEDDNGFGGASMGDFGENSEGLGKKWFLL